MDKVSLVKQCQSGDREAFGILYQTYLAPMREVVAYYIHNADIEQDVLHDGFLIAFTSIGSLKNGVKNRGLAHLYNEKLVAPIPKR